MGDALLTKSDYLDYRICPSYCWLRKHRPDEVAVPVTAADRRRFDFGNQLDRLARSLFPDGRLITVPQIDLAVARTREALDDPHASVIFQATVLVEPGFLARADILVRTESGWRLIEVKSASNLDKDHYADAAFQSLVLQTAGIQVSSVSLLHLDRNFRRTGDIDPSLLFVETDVTNEVGAIADTIRTEMNEALTLLETDSAPTTCNCHTKTRTNQCPTFARFHPEVPTSGSVYELQRLQAAKLQAVINRGIFSLTDWPPDVPLSDSQQLQVEVLRSGRPHVDRPALSQFLSALRYPIYFLDYEASSVPIPMFDGGWPYQQVPFQYSLHIEHMDGRRDHREFLAESAEINPTFALVDQLLEDIGEEGTVVVWSKAFERTRNSEMAATVPQHEAFILSLNNRMVDLMEVVTKLHYVHPGFAGSASIKKVLPVVAPDLTYKELEIQDGMMAAEAWLGCVLGEFDSLQQADIFSGLRSYCHLDTLAMVRTWEHFVSVATTGSTISEIAPA